MNNPVNPAGCLPMYRDITEQSTYRSNEPPYVVPNGYFPAVQITTSTPGDEVSVVFMEHLGRTYRRFSQGNIRSFERADGRYAHIFRGGFFASTIPEVFGYLVFLIDGVPFYSENLEVRYLNQGQRVDVTMDTPGSSTVTLRSVNTVTDTVNSSEWTYITAGNAEEDIPGANGNTATFDAAALAGTAPTLRLTRRLFTGAAVIEAQYAITLTNDPARYALIQLPAPETQEDQADWYSLDYWCDSDRFDIVFQRSGYRQRVYLEGAYDVPQTDENRRVIDRPDGTTELVSTVIKMRQQFVVDHLPKFMAKVLTDATAHDHFILTNQLSGHELTLSEVRFDAGQSEDPTSMRGTLSFVINPLYRPGAAQRLT